MVTWGRCETMVCEVHVMLDLHLNKVLLHWRSIMFSILYHRQPFSRNYNFSLIPCINFSHLANNLCMPIPIIFFIGFFTWGVHSHFILNWFTIGGSFCQNIVHLNTFSCFLSYYNNAPYLCFYLIDWWYAYCWSYFKHVVFAILWLHVEFVALKNFT